MTEEIKMIQIFFNLSFKSRKTMPRVKISSENEEKITPKINGRLVSIIAVKSGIPVMNSTPRTKDKKKGIAYNTIPSGIPISEYFRIFFEKGNPQKDNPVLLLQLPKIYAAVKNSNWKIRNPKVLFLNKIMNSAK